MTFAPTTFARSTLVLIYLNGLMQLRLVKRCSQQRILLCLTRAPRDDLTLYFYKILFKAWNYVLVPCELCKMCRILSVIYIVITDGEQLHHVCIPGRRGYLETYRSYCPLYQTTNLFLGRWHDSSLLSKMDKPDLATGEVSSGSNEFGAKVAVPKTQFRTKRS